MQRTYNHVLVSPFYLKDEISVYVVLDVANYDITYDLQINVVTWASVSLILYYNPVNGVYIYVYAGKGCEYILQVQPEEHWFHWSGGLQ